jgi:hypothetical protein
MFSDPLRRLAKRLAQTRYGQKVLAEDADLGVFRRRPAPSLFLGLAFIALSYIIGWTALVLGGYMAVLGERPLLLAVGAVAVFILVHLLFAAGV